MHVTEHPQSGKYFRLNIDDGHSQAGWDQLLHGSMFQILDWADRMDLVTSYTVQEKQVALDFYAHRCLPELSDPVRLDDIPSDGLIFGVFETKNYYPDLQGEVFKSPAIVRETELYES
jgi:hypothetical protein